MCVPFLFPSHFKVVNAAMVLLNSVRTMVTVFGILSQCLWNAADEKLCYEALNSSFKLEGEPNYLNINIAFSLSYLSNPNILESSNGLP